LTDRVGVEQRFVFDDVAELYERARPRYPDAFVDDVCRRARLTPGARILEIGCGPAIATTRFAERGYAMVCLEPGARLAELARERLARHPDVSVVTSTFEAWPGSAERFDLVLAAQSFHWVDEAVRFSKAAALLRPGGRLAIIANLPQRGESAVWKQLDDVYARFAGAFAAHAQASGTATRARLDALLGEAPEFGAVEIVRHPWTARYDTAGYLELMETQSDHRMLPADTRKQLLAGVAEALGAHGGCIDVEYEARLLLAERLDPQSLGGGSHGGQSGE
jgi:SAM-dependent methyltransferase